jgi:hypothetical protein
MAFGHNQKGVAAKRRKNRKKAEAVCSFLRILSFLAAMTSCQENKKKTTPTPAATAPPHAHLCCE